MGEDFEDDLLPLIRDEVGDSEPEDDVLEDLYESLGSWRKVALRVLKRRRASSVGAAGGTVASLSVPGAVSVGFTRSDIASLDRQITRLQAEVDAEDAGDPDPQTASQGHSGRLRRHDRVR